MTSITLERPHCAWPPSQAPTASTAPQADADPAVPVLDASQQLFVRKMLVSAASLQQELLELAAVRLDPSSLDLFCGVFAIELAVPAGRVSPSHARVFHLLFERSCTVLHAPAPVMRTPPSTDREGEGSEVASARARLAEAEVWLTTALLDSLIWLEAQVGEYRGLVEAVLGFKEAWHACAMQACPCEALPPPFDGLGTYHRMLLVVALNPDRLQSALAWYAQVRVRLAPG